MKSKSQLLACLFALSFFSTSLLYTSESIAQDRRQRPVFSSADYDCYANLERGENVVQKELKGNVKLNVFSRDGIQQLTANVGDRIVFEGKNYDRWLSLNYNYSKPRASSDFLFGGRVQMGINWNNALGNLDVLSSDVSIVPDTLARSSRETIIRTFSLQDGVIYSLFCSVKLIK